MLECTWNDSEAETALLRMRLNEQKQQKIAVNKPKVARKPPQSAVARLALKRIVGAAGASNTL
jgi:hypothetical protein